MSASSSYRPCVWVYFISCCASHMYRTREASSSQRAQTQNTNPNHTHTGLSYIRGRWILCRFEIDITSFQRWMRILELWLVWCFTWMSHLFCLFFCEEMKFKNVITSSRGVTFYVQVKGGKKKVDSPLYIERAASAASIPSLHLLCIWHYSTSFEYFMQLFPIYLFFFLYFRERDDGGGTRVMDFDLVHEIRE